MIKLDDATHQRLLAIAARHVRLALEHSKANTSTDRRKVIRANIELLRMERDMLMGAGKQ